MRVVDWLVEESGQHKLKECFIGVTFSKVMVAATA